MQINLPKQTLNPDPAITAKDNRAITVANAFAIELALKKYIEEEAMITHKTPISKIDDIIGTGIYQGMNVQGSPKAGGIVVMATKTDSGDIGYMLIGDDNVLHTGGKAHGQTVVKWKSYADGADLGDLHSLMAGTNLTDYLFSLNREVELLKSSTGQTTKEPAVGSWAIVPVTCDATSQIIQVMLKNLTQPVLGNIDLDDGNPHVVKFIKDAGSPKDIPDATTWVWATPFSGNTNAVRVFSNGKEMSSSSFSSFIKSGAWVTITFTNGKYNLSDVMIPAGASTTVKAILSNGAIDMENGYTPLKDMSVATKKYVKDNAGGSTSLFQFDYKIDVGTKNSSPAIGKISFDTDDYKQASKMYINKKDRKHTDMSLFLTSIQKGDWFNIHDNNDINKFIAFDATKDILKIGDVFVVEVSKYTESGNLQNGERVFVHWEKENSPLGNVLTDAEIKLKYERNANTNALTDAELSKIRLITISRAVNLDALYTLKHSHKNKSILENTTASYTLEEEKKLASLQKLPQNKVGYLLNDGSGNLSWNIRNIDGKKLIGESI